jgi:hypothetical protein
VTAEAPSTANCDAVPRLTSWATVMAIERKEKTRVVIFIGKDRKSDV